MTPKDNHEQEFSFKHYFIPFTTGKAIHFLLFIGLVVYGNSLFNGFVGDDNGQIVENVLIHSLKNLPYFFIGSTFYLQQIGHSVGVYYRPLLSTSFSLLYTLFGPTPFFFHLAQLFLHIGNCILLFFIFKRFFPKPLSFVLSVFFLVHPGNNEAIVYLANLQEGLYTFFGLLALKVLIDKKQLLYIPILLLLSLLSKESAFIFIPILLLAQVLLQERFDKRTLLKLSLYLILSVIVYLYIRIEIGNLGFRTDLMYMTEQGNALQRFFTIPTILSYYLTMLFYPVTIANAWYWIILQPTLTNFWLPLYFEIFFFGIMCSPLFFFRHNKQLIKLYFFFLSIVCIGMSITLQIIPLYVTVADRWLYVPLIGFLGMGGIVYQLLAKRIAKNPHGKTILISCVIAILVLFSIRDIVRNTNWVDSFTLCRHDEKANPQSFILEFCLGNEYYNRGNYPQAQLHADKATKLFPKYFFSWYTLGRSYYAEGKREQAEVAFRKTLALNNFGYGASELALVLVYEKKSQEARQIAKTYLKQNPYAAELWYALALADYQLKNMTEATDAAKHAYLLEQTAETYKLYYRLSKNLPIKY